MKLLLLPDHKNVIEDNHKLDMIETFLIADVYYFEKEPGTFWLY